MGHCSSPHSAAMACRRRRGRENYRNFACLSPWSTFSCWFGLGKSKSRKVVKGRFCDEDKKNETVRRGMHGESSSDLEESGQHGKEASFHLGVGFGLMYLMAASKFELNKIKMVELCKQMETLIQDFKGEMQNQQNNTLSTPSESNIIISCSASNGQDQEVTEELASLQELPSSFETENSDVNSTCGQNNNINMNTSVKYIEIDQLEAELEAELEHLQLQLDTEIVPNNYSDQQYSEIVVEGSAPEETKSTSFEEVFQLPEVGNNMEQQQGVSPNELERRLHELLEERQQEKIKQLEFTLECALDKLHENQRELSRWKDTARPVFQHSPLLRRSVR